MPTPKPVSGRRGARRHRVIACVVALTAIIAAACGSDAGTEGSGGSAAPAGPAKVKVGILPIADVAPIWYGIEKGIFAAERLEVEPVPAQGGAAIVPSVVSGEFQFGFSNIVSLLLAREKNQPLKIVSNLVNGAETPDRGTNAILVAPDSGISTVQDLAGKKFAVSTQKNAGEVTVKATLRNAGVDISGVQFVELAFPNMNAAVQSEQVDAAWQAEPFITLGEDAGLRSIVDPMYGTTPNLTIAAIFASEEYLERNADVANRFQRALGKAIELARNDEPGIRETIAKRTQTPPQVVPRIALANWRSELNRQSIDLQARLSKEFGILAEDADVPALIW